MTSPVQQASPFKGSCLSHIASIAEGFAKSLEGFINPQQVEYAAIQYLGQLINQHLAALTTPVAASLPQSEQQEPVQETQTQTTQS